MSIKKEVSIILPVYNGEYQLKENLPQVFVSLKKFPGQVELIASDDASTDSSVRALKALLTDCPCPYRLIEGERNLGFAGNVNRAVKFSRHDYLFLLNTDVVIKPNCLSLLLEEFEDEKVFAVGANAARHVSIASFKNGYLDISKTRKVSPSSRKVEEAFWVCGGHSMFSRRLWFELGGLDRLFSPFYFEETDLCYRAWKRGYKVLWHPQAKVDHNHAQSVIKKFFSKKRISFIAERNRLFFIWKNIHNFHMIANHCKNLIRRLFSQLSYWKVFLAALAKIVVVLSKRQTEKKKSKITDKEIFAKFTK